MPPSERLVPRSGSQLHGAVGARESGPVSDEDWTGLWVTGPDGGPIEPEHHVDEREAAPDEVQFQLTWTSDRPEALHGQLIATNVSSRTWRLSGKPVVTPLGASGRPLATEHVITLEAQFPGYVSVEPGQRARAYVTWGWWDGTETSDRVRVEWHGGTSKATVSGPTHPERAVSGHRMGTSSDWWRLAD